MTFLNPAILWGLLAVSIPIIIHIFNLKRTKKIEFSTLMFLKEIQQSKYKKIKLKQLLILLCRIAFIIFLVLMFSRPFEKGYLFSANSKIRSSVLLVLDDSFSMLSRETGGSDFDAAKGKLTETLNLFDENDEIYFSTVSNINSQNKSFIFTDINTLRDSIKNTKVSDVTRNINTVIYFSNKILESSSNPNKEIFLFTDGQKSFLSGNAPITTDVKLAENTKLNIILSGSRKGNNLSIDTVDVVTKIFEKNKPVKIKCTVTNHNVFNVANKSVIFTSSPKPYRDEKVIDIPANSSVEVEFSVVPGASGFISGNVELQQKEISDDEIPNDNKQFFTFYAPPKVKVLMASESSTDLSYLKLALSASEEMMKDSTGSKAVFYDIDQITGSDLIRKELTNYNCIIVVNKASFTSDEANKINDYINNGGGVIIYPGVNTQLENYNNTFLRIIDVPNINSKFSATESNPSYKFENIDLSHPIFDGIFTQKLDAKESILKDSPEIKSGFDLQAGKNSEPIITLNANKNFLVEYSRGKGKLLLFAVPPDLNGSNYPAKSIFSPITVRSILYLSPVNTIKPAISGKDYFLDFSGFGKLDTSSISVSLQSNNSPIGNLKLDDKNSLVNLKGFLNSNSNYKLTQKSETVFEFPSNFEKSESLLDKYTSIEITSLLKEKLQANVNVISPENTLSASILALRTGKEMWQYFLLFALLFLLIEYFIARTIKT
jgi:hypothetical protein